MKTTTIALSLVLASVAVGCAAASDNTGSEAAAATTASLSLADAQTQVAAVRAKFEPTGAHELLFDTSLAPAYVEAVRPIFANVAKADKLDLASGAFTYVSYEVQRAAILEGGVLDDAIATKYSDLVSYSFYYGYGVATQPGFWSAESALIARSKMTLSDLQVLEVVTTAKSHDFVDGLDALGWSYAPKATAAQAKLLVDAPQTFDAVGNLLFGDIATVPDGSTHDIAADDAFGAKLLTQTFSEVRILDASADPGVIVYDIGTHLREAQEDTHSTSLRGTALVESALTTSELADFKRQL